MEAREEEEEEVEHSKGDSYRRHDATETAIRNSKAERKGHETANCETAHNACVLGHPQAQLARAAQSLSADSNLLALFAFLSSFDGL
mmetsp:Transcript_36760/g.88239  ORF Transcript_36760/g.88239 Transcript_36760/m.88239 type:complete len:87 (-) Transcript_36760:73-333(-)